MTALRVQASAKLARFPVLGWGKKHGDNWHRGVDLATDQYRALEVGQGAGHYFPLDQLQDLTDYYLRKKGKNLTMDETDSHLTALVNTHPRKDVAIVACAHALSAKAVRNLLRGEVQIHLYSQIGLLVYLRAVSAISHANIYAVQAPEAQCAEILMTLLLQDALTLGQDLPAYALLAGSRTDLLLHPCLEAIPRGACANFAEHLKKLKLGRQWEDAHVASKWLRRLPGTSSTTEELLDVYFPSWRVWAVWKPNQSRLRLWKRLMVEQRGELGDILDFEGPDFITGKKATLGAGLVPQGNEQAGFSIRHGQVLLRLENGSEDGARDILGHLLDAFDRAYQMSPIAVSLFEDMCLRHSSDKRTLQTLDLVLETKEPTVASAVQDIYTSQAGLVRTAAEMRQLPIPGQAGGQTRRDPLSPLVVDAIESTMRSIQGKFCEQLQNGRAADGSGRSLYHIGQSLLNASWVQPMLSEETRLLLHRWPPVEDVNILFSLRNDLRITSLKNSSELIKMIEVYCMSFLTGLCSVTERTRNTVGGLLHVFRQPHDSDRREAALAMARRSTIPSPLLRRCLVELYGMGDNFVNGVSLILSNDTDMACVNFARLLVAQRLPNTRRIECWCDLLFDMIERRGSALLDYMLAEFGFDSWFRWLDDIKKISSSTPASALPPPFDPPFLRWIERLSRDYRAALTRFESSRGSTRYILLGWQESETIIPVLDALTGPEQGPCKPAIDAMISFLAPDGSNFKQICKALLLVTRTAAIGREVYLRVLEIQKVSKQTAELVLAAWLQSAEMTPADKRALEAMVTIIGIVAHLGGNPPGAGVQAAAAYLEGEYSSILQEAARLESVRLTLKAHDTQRTSTLLASANIEDPSTTEDAISGIPLSLLDVVEKISDNEFELFFPLDHLKEFQRPALGVGNARGLLVRIRPTNPPEFCMHLHPEPHVAAASRRSGATLSAGTGGHHYWQASSRSSAPDTHFCRGAANRATYQLSRALFRHLLRDPDSLEAAHGMLASAIDKLSHSCVVCGENLGPRLLRSTTCKRECSISLRRSDLDVRLIDLRNDPPVVDLLLSAAHAAANSRLDMGTLLPCCPITKANLLQALNSFPAVSTFQNAHDLTASVQQLGPQTELLLSWLCTSHRGFLASATGSLKVPSMPGVHQFVLLNTFPEHEKRFGAQLQAQPPSRVVFHDTSLKRLYMILRQGQVIARQKQLQAHGAVYGEGIYAADDPATALNFAGTGRGNGSNFGWAGSAFRNARVLLGCELAGSGNNPAAPRGMWVITDESRIVVRYIFLFLLGVGAPVAQHVAPAMLIAFNLLRAGSVKI